MDKETWFSAEDAVREGFVDEIISGTESEEPIAACAVVDEDVMNLMRTCYEHVPEHIRVAERQEETHSVSNEKTAVAAGNSSENMGNAQKQGGHGHMEINGATAEMIQQENPEAAQAIADAARQSALTAERERIAKIRKLTRKGAKWEALRDKAIDEGMSVEAYLEAVIAEEEKAGETYLEQRANETAPAARIGAGEATDNDVNAEANQDKAAKELAALADSMNVRVDSMF
jgi:hypothetical protein